MEEKRVLIAGATGYLGQYLVRESKRQGCWVRALTRDPNKLSHLEEYIDDIFVGEITNQDSLAGICNNINFVISSIGITRQKDGLTYMDVDYQGNRNLLSQAENSNISKFIYVSVINAHLMENLRMIKAKELFVADLKASNLGYSTIRPTGFFSDMLEFLNMAKKGRVSLFGNGENKINPIHGADLAQACINSMDKPENETNIGGPETFTFREIAELAFNVLNKEPKISTLPVWMIRLISPIMRTFVSSKTYGPLEFMMAIMTMDVVGDSYGKKTLKEFFASQAANPKIL